MRAAERVSYPGGPTPREFLGYLRGNIGRSDLGVFVGYEHGTPRGLVVAMLPTTILMLMPQLILGYNEGSRELHKLASVRIREWLREAGYNTAAALNRARADKVFSRGFADFGRPSVYGSIIKFDLKG
jgi:hypothetical protein